MGCDCRIAASICDIRFRSPPPPLNCQRFLIAPAILGNFTVPDELPGIHIDPCSPYWEVDGPESFAELFDALNGWLPEGSILYFEGGMMTDTEIETFFANYSIPEVTQVATGTIWPGEKVFHVPATAKAFAHFASIMTYDDEPILAVHFHVYRNNSVLIEWHDAFDQPMIFSADTPKTKIKESADRLGTNFKRTVH